MPPRSVLVVRLSSIGDVVHTLPAYQALRRAWPETRFGWVVEEAAAELVAALPGPLRVHVLPVQHWRRGLLRPSTLRAVLAARRELREASYEMAIDFQGLLKSAIVARCSGGTVVGLHRADVRERLAASFYHRRAERLPPGTHALRRGLHVAQAAGAAGAPVSGPLTFPAIGSEQDDAWVAAQLARLGVGAFAVMHAAANWPSKRYPTASLVQAARDLHARSGLTVLWIWGPGERAGVEALAAAAGPGQVVAFGTTLPQLAALLRRAALLVGGDSAPLHLAVACGTPVVGIFGPTDPAILGPVHPADRVVRHVLPCSHCHQRRCRFGTVECLSTISPEEVTAAALARLR